jgi:ABC-type transport system involved in cytochrome c biogenesis permease subunit
MSALVSSLPYAALGAVGASFAAELAGSARAARSLLLGAAGALVALLLWRGIAVGFLPLTTKYESFLGFALMLLLVLVYRYPRLGRPGRILLGLTASAAVVATLSFDDALRYPSPLLYTTWYAVHVPVSFAGYAFWLAVSAHALDAALVGLDARELEARQDDDLRWGLALFSAAMIFGAIWGLVSWGVYFLWDAKIVWSLAAWLYFATFLHLRLWPVRRKLPRILLGAIGFAVVAITYVGTSFMSGSIHSF